MDKPELNVKPLSLLEIRELSTGQEGKDGDPAGFHPNHFFTTVELALASPHHQPDQEANLAEK